MNYLSRNHVGAAYKADNIGLVPASCAATSTRNGTAVAPNKYMSGTLVGITGAATGTPTAVSVSYAIETRVASGTWAALKDIDGNDVEVEVTAASTAAEVDFDLQFVPTGHTELRVVETVALTAGTTPTITSAAILVLGGSRDMPV